MRPEEYRSIIKRLETRYQEFLRTSQGSELFGEEEKKTIQGHVDKAQNHYDTLIIQLPDYSECKTLINTLIDYLIDYFIAKLSVQ